MKLLRISLWILVGSLVAGNAWHFARHKSIGLFQWSSQRQTATEGGGIRIVRTDSIGPAAENSAPLPPENPPVSPISDPPPAAPEPKPKPAEPKPAPAPKPEPPKPKPKPKPPKDPNLFVLFDGKTLGKWKPIEFGGEGEVIVNDKGFLEFDFGAIMTGVKWSGKPPATSNYQIDLDAMRLDGPDFFCGLTFPVKDSHATLIVGGWGGGIVGISSVDDLNASENETMNVDGFENDVWYHIRLRVTDEKIDVWIDKRHMVDLELADKKISLLPGDIELCVPIGIASFMTRSQYKDIRWRNLTEKNGKMEEKG